MAQRRWERAEAIVVARQEKASCSGVVWLLQVVSGAAMVDSGCVGVGFTREDVARWCKCCRWFGVAPTNCSHSASGVVMVMVT